MNKLKIMLIAACTLAMASFGVAKADSSNFAGPYVGLQILGLGAEFDGTGTSTGDDQTTSNITDKVQAGATAGSYGIELGYTIPMGSNFALDIGGQYLQGKSKIAATNSDVANSAGNVAFEFDDHITGYIAPTVILSDTSSIYLKVGLSEAATSVSGDITTPADLSGQMLAVGTRTVLDSGIFIRTEAGYTDYNGIGARGKGEGTQGTTLIDTATKFSADPTIVHGVISLGFRF